MPENKNINLEIIEIEKNFLGILLNSDSARFQYLNILKKDDFIDIKNQILLSKMKELFQKKRYSFDLTLFIHYLKTTNTSKEISAEYLNNIHNSYFSDKLIESYWDVIINGSLKRFLAKKLEEIKSFLKKNPDTESLIKETFNMLTELTEIHQRVGREFVEISTLIEDFFKNKNLFSNESQRLHCSSGFLSLDKKTKGFKPGELIILAARPSMGKTALVLNMAMNNLNNVEEVPSGDIIIFSLEMSSQQLSERIVASSSHFSNVNKNDLKNHEKLKKFIHDLNKMQIFVDTSTDIDVLQIHSKLKKWQKTRKIKLVIIDYLQLLKSLQKKTWGSRNIEVAQWTRQLKISAQELKIPILCISQLSRNVERREEKRPLLSDLRDSGSIEQDADLVMFLYRSAYYASKNNNEESNLINEPHEAEIIIAKHRNGRTGTIKIIFIPDDVSFKELT